ncbi:MAG: SurA N-terminal domain-containing protein [Acidobacteriota bacterium]|nr:SurA N-terminal domain-containing protein [Acidobacteriota bacterium]
MPARIFLRRQVSAWILTWMIAGLVFSAPAFSQEVIDRIAARIENDIILLSDVRQLARYQLLVDGKSESDAQLLDRLIDQWVVQNEADASRFPRPSDADIEQALTAMKKSFASPQAYEERKRQSGLSDEQVRDKIATQLYLTNYLDSRFRPSVQVDAKAIEEFYKSAVLPRAKARGQEPPSLEVSRDTIQEALVQQSIDSQADQWLKDSRARIHVQRLLDEGTK